MNKTKRRFVLLLILCLLASALCVPALASSDPVAGSVEYYADGSYTVTTITSTSPCAFSRASVQEKSGEKEVRHYDRSDQLLWTFRVHGTFTCNGLSAKATSADYSYDIYDSAWSFSGGSASYSGATATADGSFTYRFISNPVTVSLTCSPKGVLS